MKTIPNLSRKFIPGDRLAVLFPICHWPRGRNWVWPFIKDTGDVSLLPYQNDVNWKLCWLQENQHVKWILDMIFTFLDTSDGPRCLLARFWNSTPGGMVIVDFVLNSRSQVAIQSVINGLIILTQGHVLTKIEKAMVYTAGRNTQLRVMSRVLDLARIKSVTSDKSLDLAGSHYLHLWNL